MTAAAGRDDGVDTKPGAARPKATLKASKNTALAAAIALPPAPHAPGTAPDTLLKAIAWQESGWQSEIVACDGGFGTLQIMSGTATWMNNRFGTSYDYHTLAGNTQIGSEYAEWLIAYFGEVYYADDFDVTANQSLLNDVIAAYNVGPRAVNPTGTSSAIPNPSYVANVEALTTLQPWNG